MTAWRRDLHAHPETAFREQRTSDVVAGLLSAFGMEVHRGLAGTGVVGTLRSDGGPRAIALRADMDGLPMDEANDVPYRSQVPGAMHACGHDGHMAMLLGAARELAESGRFDGTVHFIFQPAEENEGGGRVMVEEGLFDRFPVDAVFGLHNWPGLPAGHLGVRPGPVMAAFDVFEVRLRGRGAHGAMPHLAVDPVVAAAEMIGAFQTIVSRNVSPVEAAVVSVTQVQGGDTWNVIPEEARLRGSTRYFRPDVGRIVEDGIRRIAPGVAGAFGATVEVDYQHRYPATVNEPAATAIAARVAEAVAGAEGLARDLPPSLASEDFAFMLQARPGCYVCLGNGPADGGRGLHSPRYDFNDAILPVGAAYWVRLAETILSPPH
ncbi:MAG TPA: M20 aminoacylase family protein [Vicinamibacteria bacterium]|jgi:hippurate hydrolase